VGTMLKVGRGRIAVDEFRKIIESQDASRVDFSVDAQGLTLMAVVY
jgi:tRNA pseudouridine38-40 synthase